MSGEGRIRCNPRSQTRPWHRSRRREMDFVTLWSATNPASTASHFASSGDCGAAEEVAQDVFLALYRDLDRVQSQEHLLAWLRRVTVHRATDAYRRRASRVDLPQTNFVRNTRISESVLRFHRALQAGRYGNQIEQMVASLPAGATGSRVAALSGRLDAD